MKKQTQHTMATLAPRLQEDADCLIWTGYLNTQCVPNVSHAGRMCSVRRLVALLAGDPMALAEEAGQIPRGMWGNTCRNPLCVAHEHARRRTLKQHMRELNRVSNTGSTKAIRVAKMTATKRARYGKISAADLPAVLSAPTTCADEAALRGVSKSLIQRLRRQDTTRHAGGVFSGLGARA